MTCSEQEYFDMPFSLMVKRIFENITWKIGFHVRLLRFIISKQMFSFVPFIYYFKAWFQFCVDSLTIKKENIKHYNELAVYKIGSVTQSAQSPTV